MMEVTFAIVGLIGAACMVGMYWALESGRIESHNPKFYAINGLGAFLIAVSIAVDYDSADLGGIAVELAWVVISITGFYKHFKKDVC